MNEIELFARGPIDKLDPETLNRLMDRAPTDDEALTGTVRRLIDTVRARGDVVLKEMAEEFDHVTLKALEVPRSAWDAALTALDRHVRSAMERAADNIRRFHTVQIPGPAMLEVEPGVRVTRVWAPLGRVGVYAPGGRAAYPSSVLMGVVPAKAVGVPDVIVCSPPDTSGLPPIAVLAACAVAGADRLFAVGGAGAIAALSYGTQSVPRADAIVGPGNRWVTEAKRQVAGDVLIDAPAGPSEVLVIADETADPLLIAHELLAQAEHDPEAACGLVTTSKDVADATELQLQAQLSSAPRSEVAKAALATWGVILTADSLDEAIDFAARYAPEHLSVMAADAPGYAKRISTAGTIFVGSAASVAFGDYMTGANHVLPTSGRARSFSGLSSNHFMRSFTIQEIDPRGAASMAKDVSVLAEAEGFPAHAAAALARSQP